MKKNIPAISIITPMYNSEDYITECLDSILAQTFTDYELIVVDDGSTDNSCMIVEDYIPKFEGKLKLIRTKHSGSPGTPRNIGLRISRGKYIMFVDSDDEIALTALEELYLISEKFQAEVVYCEKCFNAEGILRTIYYQDIEEEITLVDKPTPISNDIYRRVEDLADHVMWIPPWNQLILRKFLSENDILFPDIKVTVDVPFVFLMALTAKKIICVPNVIYFYKKRSDSVTGNLPAKEFIHKRAGSCFRGLEFMDSFIKNHKLSLNQTTIYKIYAAFFKHVVNREAAIYSQNPAHELDPIVRSELDKVTDKTALTAFFFMKMNELQVEVNKCDDALNEMKETHSNQVDEFKLQTETLQSKMAKIRQLKRQLEELQER